MPPKTSGRRTLHVFRLFCWSTFMLTLLFCPAPIAPVNRPEENLEQSGLEELEEAIDKNMVWKDGGKS